MGEKLHWVDAERLNMYIQNMHRKGWKEVPCLACKPRTHLPPLFAAVVNCRCRLFPLSSIVVTSSTSSSGRGLPFATRDAIVPPFHLETLSTLTVAHRAEACLSSLYIPFCMSTVQCNTITALHHLQQLVHTPCRTCLLLRSRQNSPVQANRCP